jgi:hypothetical protein
MSWSTQIAYLNFEDLGSPVFVAFLLFFWSSMLVLGDRLGTEDPDVRQSIKSPRRFLEGWALKASLSNEARATLFGWTEEFITEAATTTEWDRRKQLLKELRKVLFEPED